MLVYIDIILTLGYNIKNELFGHGQIGHRKTQGLLQFALVCRQFGVDIFGKDDNHLLFRRNGRRIELVESDIALCIGSILPKFRNGGKQFFQYSHDCC